MRNTKDAIFKSAIKIFSDKGYTAATMDDIATDAGVAKGTLYYYFKSKEEIFYYIISKGMELVKTQLHDAISSQGNPIAKLTKAWEFQVNLICDNRDFFKVLMSQMWGKELRHLEIRETMKKYISEIESYVSDAMKSGAIKKADPAVIAYTFLGTLCSTIIYQLLNDDKKNITELKEVLNQYPFNNFVLA